MKIGIIYGSSRPSTKGKVVAEWFASEAKVEGVEFEMIDLKEVDLPFFDEPKPPIAGDYQNDHTKAWAARIAPLDGFVMVAAEYNQGPTPILKNAIDYLYAEWKDKPVSVISYGAAPKSHAAEMVRHILDHMGMNVLDNTLHVVPSSTAVTDDGVVPAEYGDSPSAIVEKLKESK